VTQAFIALAVVAVALVVAAVLRRRQHGEQVARPAPAWVVPERVDRRDFASPPEPWLVAVFTSSTCEACALVAEKAQVLASSSVAVQELEAIRDQSVHQRYGINAVPLVIVCDQDGVVRHHTLGPVTATDLWAAVADVRNPTVGTNRPGCHDHDQHDHDQHDHGQHDDSTS
jgi:hypothetical protein